MWPICLVLGLGLISSKCFAAKPNDFDEEHLSVARNISNARYSFIATNATFEHIDGTWLFMCMTRGVPGCEQYCTNLPHCIGYSEHPPTPVSTCYLFPKKPSNDSVAICPAEGYFISLNGTFPETINDLEPYVNGTDFTNGFNAYVKIPGRCNPNFVDKDGDNCQAYADENYCTINGDYGKDWNLNEEFKDYAVNGEDATVCPQCGCIGIDCVWGIWSEWGTCSKTCGNGTKTRNRTKLVVEDVTGACNGTSMESDSCNPIACPAIDCVWGIWSEWGACSKTCGEGTKTRTRTKLVVENDIGVCNGQSMESDSCNLRACPGPTPTVCKNILPKHRCRKILMNGKCGTPWSNVKCCKTCRAGCANIWKTKKCMKLIPHCTRSSLVRRKCQKACRKCK